MKQHLDNLLQEASEDDCIHDVVFQVTVSMKGGYVLCLRWFLINYKSPYVSD